MERICLKCEWVGGEPWLALSYGYASFTQHPGCSGAAGGQLAGTTLGWSAPANGA